MKLPEDPMMLLSFINTQLRDNYPSLDELCRQENLNRCAIEKKLGEAGFEYDEDLNRFA